MLVLWRKASNACYNITIKSIHYRICIVNKFIVVATQLISLAYYSSLSNELSAVSGLPDDIFLIFSRLHRRLCRYMTRHFATISLATQRHTHIFLLFYYQHSYIYFYEYLRKTFPLNLNWLISYLSFCSSWTTTSLALMLLVLR